MKYLDLSFADPASNLAFDEALLELCEENPSFECLRTWQSSSYFVVLGFSNKVSEARVDACLAGNVPILRRCSGGGTVLQGPGCLNYSLILSADSAGSLGTVPAANCHIMTQHQRALAAIMNCPVEISGHTDLTIGGVKFSGNAQRRKRNCLLFHGTFLCNFDLPRIDQLLNFPSQAPSYRAGRQHGNFLRNLNHDPLVIANALRDTWQATDSLCDPPMTSTLRLVEDKYATDAWNQKF